MMMLTRRSFHAGLVTVALSSLASASHARPSRSLTGNSVGYGPLITDPKGLLDLPRGFSYRVISELGQTMDDGHKVPDRADGMGSIALGDGKFALVRNHELKVSDLAKNVWANDARGPARAYDRTAEGIALMGGTTTMIIDQKSGRLEQQYMSLAGTIRNCAGGTTPWGSWLSCEEDLTQKGTLVGKDHGWVFEVPARHKGLVDPVPLTGLGRFNHEAAAVDPVTGIVYLTEDEADGLLYRFLPNAKGELGAGGRLQALGLVDAPMGSDARNWTEQVMERGRPLKTRWIDLDGIDNSAGDLRKRGHKAGATLFARGEGIHNGANEVYFTCTSGGKTKLGQVMRYRPSPQEGRSAEKHTPGHLELVVESQGPSHFNYADNIQVAPNGHLIICEDQSDDNGPVDNHLRGMTPAGDVYAIARLRTQSELAGICFSPDGRTMFLNVYQPAQTLAITGPWSRAKLRIRAS
jgi:uncharacterized protein